MSSHALNPPFSWTVIVLRGGTIEREGDDRRIGNEGTESFKLPTGSSRNFAGVFDVRDTPVTWLPKFRSKRRCGDVDIYFSFLLFFKCEVKFFIRSSDKKVDNSFFLFLERSIKT